MPARKQITRESLTAAALDMARAHGMEAINARSLARALNCSTQPIYLCFENMDELRESVRRAASQFFERFIEGEMHRSPLPPYKAYGLGYIHFARQEPELFRLLFMRDRSGEPTGDGRAEMAESLRLAAAATGLSPDDAYSLQLKLWFFIHGIATMLATGYLRLDDSTISALVTDAFQAFSNPQQRGGCAHEEV